MVHFESSYLWALGTCNRKRNLNLLKETPNLFPGQKKSQTINTRENISFSDFKSGNCIYYLLEKLKIN